MADRAIPLNARIASGDRVVSPDGRAMVQIATIPGRAPWLTFSTRTGSRGTWHNAGWAPVRVARDGHLWIHPKTAKSLGPWREASEALVAGANLKLAVQRQRTTRSGPR